MLAVLIQIAFNSKKSLKTE